MARRGYSSRRRRRGDGSLLYRLLSGVLVCACVATALTMFFRVREVEVTGAARYTEEEVCRAAGIRDGDNLFFLNKYKMAGKIAENLPYVEEIRINRRFPDTLIIAVRECGTPLAVYQDGAAWLISAGGKIVEQTTPEAASACPRITGCALFSPAVGAPVSLTTDQAEQSSLLDLLSALRDAEMLGDVDYVRMDDGHIYLGYAGRFTVKLPDGADYPFKLRALREYLARDVIQENMTGIFDMTGENVTYFQPPG